MYDEDTGNLDDDEQEEGERSALMWNEQGEGLTDVLEEEGHISLSEGLPSREQFIWGKKRYATVKAAVYS